MFFISCLHTDTFFGPQFITSRKVNGQVILELSAHRQRSIFPLGHMSITAFKTCCLTSTSTVGASLQKQKPATFCHWLVFFKQMNTKALARVASHESEEASHEVIFEFDWTLCEVT